MWGVHWPIARRRHSRAHFTLGITESALAALFIACLFTACLAAKLDISQFLQSVADDLPRGDTRIHRAYVARIVLPKSGASTSYPPLSAVQTQLFSSSHNAVTGDYVPPQHKVPEGHPHPPPKPKPVPFPGPTDLELKTILEQLRPGSLSRSEIHGHKNEVEGGEFLVEGSRVWVGRKAWVVREWDRGTTKRWSEDDWMTGKAAAEGAKRGEEHQGEEEERGAVALGHGHYLYLRLIPTEQSEFALVLAHGPVGNPLPPPDVSENAGVINEAVTKAAAIITKKLGMKNKESTKPRDEL